ncbi:hypothetical protein [Bordetella bronchialis]|uniref:Uncharacterized protein n=1 Tax=Bordetella bronchialis TaxID=463025 RepID=A0A193FT13_9BORD|nr:hypothetical protein [Bordetella bronchialis]ANN70892.1 hypothetical protein BAU08_05700 [Bordetella bronchialis]
MPDDEALALSYALAKQLSSAYAVETNYGRLDLDDELCAAVDAAIRPILKRRLNALAAGMLQRPGA